ncbi:MULTISPECIES: PAS domain-containing protein [Methylobacterium]|uniref:PAS domain-containing protein n=1 Tax=Methylobacterium TaxID=407 RepID=UPI0013ECF192|nr:PAS domain-containing protein [Methylobacterium sp. DB0501]NGM35924.1 PAS domain-containing protein [Methylobacterium sp. DB0501]
MYTVEECGFAGSWHWSFESGEQRWSPGLFRLLGLRSDLAPPSYGLFLDLVHPEDQAQMASPGMVAQGVVLPQAIVRVIRPSGEMRTLSVLSELHVSPEGRPLAVNGVALDVTDRERLRQLQLADERRRQALYLTSYTASFFVGPDLVHEFPAEVAQVHGLSQDELQVDPFLMVVPDERAALRDRGWERHDRRLHFQAISRERLASGELVRFRLLGVPVWSSTGDYVGWAGMKYPIHASGVPGTAIGAFADNGVRLGLEQSVRGQHLRAARGLLAWSMSTLAEAGGLSLSTVRRLEEEAEGQGSRSRHKAVDALRKAGIRFIAMEDGSIAVAKM